MTAALVLQMIGGAGFLAGVVAVLHFFNTRKSTRSKGSAEAYQAYRTFVAGAFEDAAGVTARVTADRDKLGAIRIALIDLCQAALSLARRKGATQDELEPLYDQLDEVRSR
ncbi:hypothetical protein I5G62_gp21 [Mycobacterium phage CRB2]|uniref:Uncharacterized protein n=1 Tax=Mycobacterium phage CRB2 TaxID=2483623 RepID=A0A455LM48_9CAUD|nr:hypothetical protein I5G62_gp21 [Mycobacterium phage CRB2]AYP70007.1 hypothetical protein CRB2_21 [Mycobacterium phage CRB2]